jgi:hypothetical protein
MILKEKLSFMTIRILNEKVHKQSDGYEAVTVTEAAESGKKSLSVKKTQN